MIVLIVANMWTNPWFTHKLYNVKIAIVFATIMSYRIPLLKVMSVITNIIPAVMLNVFYSLDLCPSHVIRVDN